MKSNLPQRPWLLLLLTLYTLPVTAADSPVYHCKTDKGEVYSQSPCEPQHIEVLYSSPIRPDSKTGLLDTQLFDTLAPATPAITVLKLLGSPAARYHEEQTEHWLYPNAVKTIDSKRHNPEILVRNDQSLQVNWLPEATMQQALTQAQKRK